MRKEAALSLFRLLEPGVLADPYPLYRPLREHSPVHWDPYLHSWIVTGYKEAVTVLTRCKAARTPTPQQLESMGLSVLAPHAAMMLRQMLFMDAPNHTRLRSLCATAFTPARVAHLRRQTEDIANDLIHRALERNPGRLDLVEDFSDPFAATFLTSFLGCPAEDRHHLKRWAIDLIDLLGNSEHDPGRLAHLVASVGEVHTYLAAQVAHQRTDPRDGLIGALLHKASGPDRLNEEEIVANVMLMIAGGFEEAANLIGSGIFSLLSQPQALAALRNNPELAPAAIEELLRFESPTQHTGRIAAEDVVLAGKQIRKGASFTIVLAAANRDPEEFADPDILDLTRTPNRHLAFGWAAHYCLGAPLTRMMSQVAFNALLHRLPGLALVTTRPQWRALAAMRGLHGLEVSFDGHAALSLAASEAACR